MLRSVFIGMVDFLNFFSSSLMMKTTMCLAPFLEVIKTNSSSFRIYWPINADSFEN